jgi:hypothetical protein
MRRAFWLLSLAVGCGGGDGGTPGGGSGPSGMAGMYRNAAQTQARPCEASAEGVPIDPPYFRVIDRPLANGFFVDVVSCTGADPSTCDERGLPLVGLGRSDGAGGYLSEQLNRSQSDDGSCLVTWYGRWVRPATGGVAVREEIRNGTWRGAMCTADEVDRTAGRAFECVVAEDWMGTKL